MERPVVLVIRGDDRFSHIVREEGFEVLNLELIRTEPLADLREFDRVIARIGEYDGIFVTSPAAAEVLAARMNGGGAAFPGNVYVLGKRARRILEGTGLKIAGSKGANTAAELIDSFEPEEFAGKRLLFVRGDRTVGTITERLAAEASVEEIVVYRTVDTKPDEAAVERAVEFLTVGKIEWICFFSPSGVDAFISLMPVHARPTAAAIGETTAKRATEAGFIVGFVSQRATAEDFAAGLAAYIKSIE